jgi:hypothetical protein
MLNYETVNEISERYNRYVLYLIRQQITLSPNPDKERERISHYFSFHYLTLNCDSYLSQLRKIYDEFQRKRLDFMSMLNRLEIERQKYHAYLGLCEEPGQLTKLPSVVTADSKSKIRELLRWKLFSRIIQELVSVSVDSVGVVYVNHGAVETQAVTGTSSS